jgi:hypothetical protein
MSNHARSPVDEARLAAFCDPNGPEVFGGIVHGSMIWKPDPFDVESIHAEAREEFGRLLNRASTSAASGKSLLLLGEAGSGKTHLMRAFRNETHASRLGYCGYLQMTARADNYARYVLSNLVDALDQPYQHPHPVTGFGRLAIGLLDTLDVVSAEERRRLCDEIPDISELSAHVQHISDFVVQYDQFKGVDLDLIRALLYLLSHDGRIRPRVLKWLRCENLSRADSALLGDLEPRSQDDQPRRMIEGLGRIMSILHQAALVLCVDQLEETIDQLPSEAEGARWHHLRQAINVLIDVTDALPNAIVVVACLEDLFQIGRNYLPKPKLDRLLHDPEPLRLSSQRSPEEIETMLARRLGNLYAEMKVAPAEEESIFPFRREHLQTLVDRRTRDVLDYFRRHRDRCMQAGDWVEPDGAASVQPVVSPSPLRLEQAWNDALASFEMPTLDDEAHVAGLLAWAFSQISVELPHGLPIRADLVDSDVRVGISPVGSGPADVLVSVCNRGARGGGLKKQLLALAERAATAKVVVVRTSPFPADPKTEIARQLAALMEPKGTWRREEILSTDLRYLEAFRAFYKQHQDDADFSAWQAHRRPLSNIKSINAMLALDTWQERAPTFDQPTESLPAAAAMPPWPEPSTPAPEPGMLRMGETRGLNPKPVNVPVRDLMQHAAFLGGSGSGKTTAALCLIEQLLEQGVPAVLVDRKGDLCRYADAEAWPDGNDQDAGRRARLRDRIDVALFTPNSSHGRPLTLPLIPSGTQELPSADREQIAQIAAAGLASMMGYPRKPNDPRIVILAKAIELLEAHAEGPVALNEVKKLVVERDDSLCLELDAFDDKHYKKLGEDLQALSMRHARLLENPDAETLDLEMLLGVGLFAKAGKTRLTIINTQFLGDAAVIDFWIAQFLVAVDRWSKKHPSPDRLQAVFLFDEADQYLPATRQPATKAPMENLLRRARSRGIGLFLATQSPGDLDYKCRDQIRTWLLGRIREKVAIDKLRPMLSGAAGDVAARLPGQATGEFYLVREKELQAIRTMPCLLPTAQLAEDRILELARKRAAL